VKTTHPPKTRQPHVPPQPKETKKTSPIPTTLSALSPSQAQLLKEMGARASRRWQLESPPPEEVEQITRALDKQRESPEWYYWVQLLLALDDYRERGESALFRTLSPLIMTNYDFVVQRWWVRALLSQWYTAGEQKKYTRLLFGQNKMGARGFSIAMQNFQRDWKVILAVQKLIQEKDWSITKASGEVSKRWKELDLREKPSIPNIKKIYNRRLAHKHFAPLLPA
jgi:hypothetical protein